MVLRSGKKRGLEDDISHVELPTTKKRKIAKSNELSAKKPKPVKMAKKAKSAPRKGKKVVPPRPFSHYKRMTEKQ